MSGFVEVPGVEFLTDFQLGWLAGLLEGEGSFGLQRSKYTTVAGEDREYRYPLVQLQMTDRDTVERAGALLGCQVMGPYQYEKNRKPFYSLHIPSELAARLMGRIQPFMSDRRAARIEEVFSDVR